MKNYIYMSLAMALSCVLSLGFTSCSNDDDNDVPKPAITLTEVGHDNARHVHPGHDLHLEADVLAEGQIQRIDIEIHQENGDGYKIEKVFTSGKYIGVKNAEFHEHIDIPADAPLGEYHLHFTVTDQKGQQTTANSELEVVEDDGDEDEEEHEHHHE
ncbi:MAG: DUF4625 domain-containing protein [Bacteroidaceae bacterium]|nr:DUF4625 domain-containing protein [Bacteroidaceae bacterium]